MYSDDDTIEAAGEVFEIEDFTCPSSWEKFVAQLEQVIREWGLASFATNTSSQSRSESPVEGQPATLKLQQTTINFYDFEFSIERVQIPDGQAARFPSGSHPVHYFYGVTDFVTLSPKIPEEKEDIDNETRAKLVLSTVSVAVQNTACQVPFFVQVMERYKVMYAGVGLSGNLRTNYNMIVLSKKPPHCKHLAGILSLFKSKLCQPFKVEIPWVKVTARCSYALDDWTSHAWSQAPPDLDMFTLFGGRLGFVSDLTSLPFGSTKDPIKRLVLHTTWSDLQEDIITDNDVHSDLDPMEAPFWSLGLQFEDKPQCLMQEYLNQFLGLVDHCETVNQLLGDLVSDDPHLERLPNALNKLTGPSYTLTDIIHSGRSKSTTGGPISDQHLTKILQYLFPDSQTSPEHPYPEDLTSASNEFRVPISGIKSCPEGGLLWRLTISLAHCHHVFGGIKPFAHLIHEFLLEIRYRWESGHLIPGVPPGQPDHGYSVFHQKLQMVNCCIKKKMAREQKSNKAEDSSDEEFFECNDESEEDDADEEQTKPVPVWNQEATGRMEKFGKVKLLEQDEWLYIPECQDPTPMTEDMLAEQAEVSLRDLFHLLVA